MVHRGRRTTSTVGALVSGLAVTRTAVWAACAGAGTLYRIDPRTGTAGPPLPTGAQPTWFARDENNLFVSNPATDSVTQIDPDTGKEIRTVRAGRGPLDGTVATGYAWIINGRSGSVSKVDVHSGRIVATTLRFKTGIWVAERAFGSVWALDYSGNTVWRIDPERAA